jgi:type VI secretion system secreted protein VgrG
VHVKGHFTENIDSGETRQVDAGSTETINAGKTFTVNGGEGRTVNGGAKETINGGETRTVNGGTIETINGGETRTVNGGLTETVNGGITQTVNGGVTINSPGGFTIVAPGGTRTVDNIFDSIGGTISNFFGNKIDTAGGRCATTVVNVNLNGVSHETNGLKAEETSICFTAKFVDMATTGVSIHNKPIEMNWGFHIIS